MDHAIQRFFQVSLLLLLSFSTTCLWGQLKGDTYAKAKASGTANWVITYSEAPGFVSNLKGEMSGITVDLMKAFEKYVEAKMNIQVNMTYKVKDPDNLSMVINDPKMFTNVDFTYYLDAMQQRKPVKRHPGGDDTAEEFGIIMPKSNDWSPLLKDFMDSEFLNSVEYKKIIVDNLGQSAMKFFATLK